ncbi:MAG: hypothetical protein ACPG31_12495 [Planctomycetota bacterium]
MKEDFKAVASFSSSMEAHISRVFVEGNGYPCFLGDEVVSQLAWHLTRAIGGVKLYVRSEDLEEVRALLKNHEQQRLSEAIPLSKEERLDHRRRDDPRRAFRAAMLSLIFPPLALYAVWVTGRAVLSRPDRPWTEEEQMDLAYGGLLGLLIAVVAVVMLTKINL